MSQRPRSDDTTLMPYWERVAAQHASGDPLGAVCFPGMPGWFNRFYARFQVRAVEATLAGVPLGGRRCLDVGCGSGRWTRWLAAQSAEATGVDPTAAMLERARAGAPGLDFREMSATHLDFADRSFDVVMSVTVIQHLHPEEQARAAGEMARVLRPGGLLLVDDLIDPLDNGHIVFPRSAPAWIDLYAGAGLSLLHWRGLEFTPLLRLPAALLALGGERGGGEVAAPTTLERIGRSRLLTALLWPLILASYPLEHLSERVLPATLARHGCFLFRKPGTPPGTPIS